MQKKRVKKSINGILLLDKPKGLSSNQALQKAKYLYQAAKAGHTGTLDPMATGVLPVCFGEATKFSQYLTDADKAYQATLKLGVTTTTGDAEGEVLQTRPVDCDVDRFSQVCEQFVGEIAQTPPMYSALKFEGKPLYEYARAGIEIERPARKIHIHSIQVDAFEQDIAQITVHCSKGTYIRTLAEDIGEQLGCGSHLIGLRRTLSGPFSLSQSLTIEQLASLNEAQKVEYLLPVDQTVTTLPAVTLTQEMVDKIRLGQTIKIQHGMDVALIKLYDEAQCFIGLGEPKHGGAIKPKRLMQT